MSPQTSALARVTQASRHAQRTERGADRIPAVWRARVVVVRDEASEAGSPPGVYVTVPRLTGSEILGPIPWIGARPVAGALVLVAAVEGRKADLVIINATGVDAELRGRMGALEWEVEQLEDLVTSWHGETVNAVGILEAQMGVLDSVVEAHQLGEVTWIDSSRVEIPGYTPQPVARSYRLEMDIVTEDHVSDGDLWLRIMDGSTHLMHLRFDEQVNLAGDTHRYRFAVDFNAPANADLELTFSSDLVTPTSGRAGYTRPQLITPIVRSA